MRSDGASYFSHATRQESVGVALDYGLEYLYCGEESQLALPRFNLYTSMFYMCVADIGFYHGGSFIYIRCLLE